MELVDGIEEAARGALDDLLRETGGPRSFTLIHNFMIVWIPGRDRGR